MAGQRLIFHLGILPKTASYVEKQNNVWWFSFHDSIKK